MKTKVLMAYFYNTGSVVMEKSLVSTTIPKRTVFTTAQFLTANSREKTTEPFRSTIEGLTTTQSMNYSIPNESTCGTTEVKTKEKPSRSRSGWTTETLSTPLQTSILFLSKEYKVAMTSKITLLSSENMPKVSLFLSNVQTKLHLPLTNFNKKLL